MATFARASTAYKQDGTMVASGVPRYEVAKFGQGLMGEGGTTNIALYSSDFTNAVWVKNTAITVTSNADGIADLITNTSTTANSEVPQQSFTADGGPLTFSVGAKPNTGSASIQLGIYDFTAGAYLVFTAIPLDAGKYDQASVSVPSTVTGHRIDVYIWIPLSTSLYLKFAQLERKPYPTSPMDTLGTTVTRSDETITIPNTAGILNEAEGEIEIYAYEDGIKRVGYIWDTDGTNRFSLNKVYGASPFYRVLMNGVTIIDGIPTPSIGIHRYSVKWSGKNVTFLIDGVVKEINFLASPVSFAGITTMWFCSRYVGDNQWNNVIDDLRISNKCRTDAEDLTAYNNNMPLPVDPYTTAKLNFDGDLSTQAWVFQVTVKAVPQKILRIFDRTHVILDEIMNYTGLKYTWTLNGMGKSEFDLGLEDVKCTVQNMQYLNHLEIVDENNVSIWGGQIVDHAFDEPKLHIGCFGYLSLFQKRRLRAKTYTTQAYGDLLSAMINDTNAIANTSVSIGSIATGSLLTTRIVQNTDYLLDKIIEYNNDANYDYEVDPLRKFNFYLRKGTDKPQYILEYGGQADNILTKPQLSGSIQDMANSAYAETGGLNSTAQDTVSQGIYGLLEVVLSVNSGITIQSTLDNMAVGAVQRTAYPINSFSITAKDSSLCPFSDISVGDAVTVSLIPYFGFKALMRIIEMTHDESTGRRDIVFGQIIYRPVPPTKKFYKK